MKHSHRFLLMLILLIGLVSASSFAQESTAEAPNPENTSEAPGAEMTAEATPDVSAIMDRYESQVEIITADFEGAGAFVRILNLLSDEQTFDIYIDEQMSDTANLSFGKSGNWLVLPAGSHTFTLRSAGDTSATDISSFEITLNENEPLIIALVDGTEGPSALLIRDNYDDVAPSVGTVNFVNALNSEQGVNFLRDGVVFVSAVNAASEGMTEVNNSLDVDAGEYTFTATYFGTDEAIAVEPLELAVRDEDNYLIVLAGTEENPQLLAFETSQAQVNMMRGEMEAPGTVLDALRAMGYEQFVTMLENADMAEMLSGEGPYTIFVPADFLMDELAASGEDMNTALQNYIVEGDWRSSDILRSEGDITMMGGQTYRLGANGSTLAIGNARILDVNIVATNGTIHVIDNLLTGYDWPELSPEVTPEATATGTQ